MNHIDYTLECKQSIQNGVKQLFGCLVSLDELTFDTPPSRELGDLAFGCFALAKKIHEPPQKISYLLEQHLAKQIKPTSLVQHVKSSGPYLNITLHAEKLARIVLFTPSFWKQRKKLRKKIIVEFISPNTNKPLHLGHARNAVLGESISRILEEVGYIILRTNLINDRGIHICKSMTAYQNQNSKLKTQNSKLPTPKSEHIKGDHFVGDYYVLYEKLLKSNPEIEQQARNCLLQWEGGDKNVRALWKKMNSWALHGITQTYKRLGISFDRYYFESEMYTKGKEIVEKGLISGVFKQDTSGAVIAKLTTHHLPDKVLLRKDGTSLYITQDLYLAVTKMNEYHAQQSIYVVCDEQNLYFKQLFKILELLNYPWAQKCFHLSYGLVLLPEGRMKSREGTTVDIDTLLDELEQLSKKELLAREKTLSLTEVKKRTHAIAHAALMYYLVGTSPKSEMVFKTQESISFQGKTGPYLLYTYARFKNIARKKIIRQSQKKQHSYTWEKEKNLLLLMAEFHDTLERSANEYNPTILAHYLYTLAKTATEYYHATPILKASIHEQQYRLRIVSRLCDLLRKGLHLLTIQTLERM